MKGGCRCSRIRSGTGVARLSQVRSWREGGTVMQIDAVALLAGGRMGEMALALIEEGLADCLASDNHGDTRSLAMVRQWFGGAGRRGACGAAHGDQSAAAPRGSAGAAGPARPRAARLAGATA